MANDKTQPDPTNRPRGGYWRNVWRRFRSNRRGVVGFCFVLFLILTAFLSPLIATSQPIACKYEGKWYFPAVVEIFQSREPESHWIKKSKPFNRPQFKAKDAEYEFEIWPLIRHHENKTSSDIYQTPSREHWLGTDESGRDVAARLVHGTSVAIKVGFISMAIASFIGIVLGGLAGYFGGWIDIVISRLIEVVICFPTFFLILTILVVLPPSITNVMIVIGLTRWTSIARYTRGEFLRIKSIDYVLAARALGVGNARIMFRHMLPNALSPVLVTITFGIAGAILIEAALSWLGFGVQAPTPSWGNMLRGAYNALGHAPYLVYPPCIAIFLAVLAYNLVGDALRDAIDPYLTKK